MRKVLLVLGMLAAIELGGGGVALADTYWGAQYDSWYWMSKRANCGGTGCMGNWHYVSCSGPWENVRGHTQWACYQPFTRFDKGLCWQVNVDPWGKEVYYRIHWC